MDSLLSVNGALALTPGGGSLLAVAGDGAPCCCGGGCDAYFRAVACGDSSPCPSVPADIYVCAGMWLATTCAALGHRVIVIGGLCYRVDDSGPPIPTEQLPPGAFTLDTPGFDCRADCGGGCTLPSGYYQFKMCACSETRPGQVNILAVIDCNCEWANRAAGMACPTYSYTASNGATYCLQADLFAPPVQLVPGTEILCVPVGDGCCSCCPGCGTYRCQGFTFTHEPNQGTIEVYGPQLTKCCGEVFRATLHRRIVTRADGGSGVFTIRVETWDWDALSSDDRTWTLTHRILDYDISTGQLISDITEGITTPPVCGDGPGHLLLSAVSYGRWSETAACTESGWKLTGQSVGGTPTTPGGEVTERVTATFEATLGFCGGPCERGDGAPYVRRGSVAWATISSLPPLPLLGGLL